MQVWLCLCVLLIQAYGLPQQYSEAMRQRYQPQPQYYGAVPPSRHAPAPVYSPAVQQQEPVYPPAALPSSLLSVGEQMGVAGQMEQIPSFDPMIPGYIPTSTPFDNPTTLSAPVAPLPSTPDCTVRPQTVVEIQRMRESASKIAVMMQQETLVMNKRKTYVEQMTSYLNDRILELNKVKRELSQETKWLDLSSNRIFELEEKEKLIKLQDIQTCLNDRTQQTSTDQTNVAGVLHDIQSQQTTVQASISQIQARIAQINSATGNAAAGASTGQ